MPIFEYHCRGCEHDFELLVLKGTAIECPKCQSADLERLLSIPAVKSESTHAQAMKAAKKSGAAGSSSGSSKSGATSGSGSSGASGPSPGSAGGGSSGTCSGSGAGKQ